MHFMDILQKCDILDVIKQKQHFVTVFFLLEHVLDMGTFTMTAQPHTFEETRSHPVDSVCRHTYSSTLSRSCSRVPSLLP